MQEVPLHQKEILLVEDEEHYFLDVMRWLQEEGYNVTLATSLQQALAQLNSASFHLAIVDIRLEKGDIHNEDGLLLLKEIAEQGWHHVMPCVVLTAYASVDNIWEATQKYDVAAYVRKAPGFLTELVATVRRLFINNVRINFELQYNSQSEALLSEMAHNIRWEEGEKPAQRLLVRQIKDLIGRLFSEAKRVYLSQLQPGLTGAVVVRVRPTWHYGPGPSHVLKISRRDKAETEQKHYEKYGTLGRYSTPSPRAAWIHWSSLMTITLALRQQRSRAACSSSLAKRAVTGTGNVAATSTICPTCIMPLLNYQRRG
jgi:ActR/RegA family two-component response regulator